MSYDESSVLKVVEKVSQSVVNIKEDTCRNSTTIEKVIVRACDF